MIHKIIAVSSSPRHVSSSTSQFKKGIHDADINKFCQHVYRSQHVCMHACMQCAGPQMDALQCNVMR